MSITKYRGAQDFMAGIVVAAFGDGQAHGPGWASLASASVDTKPHMAIPFSFMKVVILARIFAHLLTFMSAVRALADASSESLMNVLFIVADDLR